MKIRAAAYADRRAYVMGSSDRTNRQYRPSESRRKIVTGPSARSPMLCRSVVLIAVLTAHANAQSAPSAGVPHADGRLLRLTTDSLEVYVVRHGEAQRT